MSYFTSSEGDGGERFVWPIIDYEAWAPFAAEQRQRTVAAKAELPAPSRAIDAPTRSTVRLLPLGEIKLRDGRGPFRIEGKEHAERVIAATRSYLGSTDMMVDYDHQAVFAAKPGVGGVAVASGWIKAETLKVGEDGIYAVVDWTAVAAERLATSQYRYISPVFRHDAANRVTHLLNAALTNSPAIDMAAVDAARSMDGGKGERGVGGIAADAFFSQLPPIAAVATTPPALSAPAPPPGQRAAPPSAKAPIGVPPKMPTVPPAKIVTGSIKEYGVSDIYKIAGPFTFMVAGEFQGMLHLEQSPDGGKTWYPVQGKGEAYVQVEGNSRFDGFAANVPAPAAELSYRLRTGGVSFCGAPTFTFAR